MKNINFHLRSTTEKKPQSIWAVFFEDNKRIRMNTNQMVLPKDWSKDKQKSLSGNKDADKLNKILNEQETFLGDYFSELRLKQKRFYEDELRYAFNRHFNIGEIKPVEQGEIVDFIGFIENHIASRKDLQKGSVQTLEATKRHIILAFNLCSDKQIKEWDKMTFRQKKFNPDFLKPIKQILFEDINYKWMEKFNVWLYGATFKTKKSGVEVDEHFSKNYIAKQISIAKRFCTAAVNGGYVHNLSYKGITAGWEDADNVHLNWDEIERLKALKLDPDTTAGKVRNLFVFNCYLGLRYSDLCKLDKNRFVTRDEQLFLKIRMQKTDGLLDFPVLPSAEKILKIYNYQLPNICEPTFNDELKKLAFDADIINLEYKRETRGGKKVVHTKRKFEMISSHTGRRSFATNFEADGVPVNQLMLVTGHTTEKSFRKYVKRKAESHFREFIALGANR